MRPGPRSSENRTRYWPAAAAVRGPGAKSPIRVDIGPLMKAMAPAADGAKAAGSDRVKSAELGPGAAASSWAGESGRTSASLKIDRSRSSSDSALDSPSTKTAGGVGRNRSKRAAAARSNDDSRKKFRTMSGQAESPITPSSSSL